MENGSWMPPKHSGGDGRTNVWFNTKCGGILTEKQFHRISFERMQFKSHNVYNAFCLHGPDVNCSVFFHWWSWCFFPGKIHLVLIPGCSWSVRIYKGRTWDIRSSLHNAQFGWSSTVLLSDSSYKVWSSTKIVLVWNQESVIMELLGWGNIRSVVYNAYAKELLSKKDVLLKKKKTHCRANKVDQLQKVFQVKHKAGLPLP